ncbi:MAG: hypothetical protein IJU84_06140 [Clostridia bacterium]|nr:hypothetical protein [Clostridia bacterium]
MKYELDITKAKKLRAIINECPYAFKYNFNQYVKICTVLDRLEDTVFFLNDLELAKQGNGGYATDFIIWINFAHLIYNCIFELDDVFVSPRNKTLFYKNIKDKNRVYVGIKDQRQYFSKYYIKREGHDDEFFIFLRSIVLAHSLESDFKEFNKYYDDKKIYTPSVKWKNNETIGIKYYVKKNNESKYFEIKMDDFFNYLNSRYNYLDTIFTYIERKNETEKKNKEKEYNKALKLPNTTKEKYDFVLETHKRLGDIDAKNSVDGLSFYLNKTINILNYKFKTNKTKIELFYDFVDSMLAIEMEALIKQDRSLSVISNFYNGCSETKERGLFSIDNYEINKIINECTDYQTANSTLFVDCFSKTKDLVCKYVDIDDKITNLEKAYLCIISYCFDNVLYDKKLSEKFDNLLITKLKELYKE